MYRRLYFLLPSTASAQSLVGQLIQLGIARKRLHTVAGQGADISGLPPASSRQLHDVGASIESWLWESNLAAFFIALISLAVMLMLQVPWPWHVLPLAIMLLDFTLGLYFAIYIPNVHLQEFHQALKHREILLMVDVKISRVAEVEAFVHHHHPEAVVGGSGWNIELLGT